MNVVITGATKGIGLAIANTFAGAGYHIITCSRNENDLKWLQQDLQKRFGISVKYKVADIGNESEIKAFGNWIVNEELSVDVLINNAGYFVPGAVYNEDDGILQKMMETNVYGSYHLIRLLLPGMIGRKNGHIFNICSVASFHAFANVGAYGISKFALLGLTRHLREELKPFGIKVTAVSPGATFTASWEGSNVDPRRIIDANDVAKMIFAASQLSPSTVVEDIILRPQLGDL